MRPLSALLLLLPALAAAEPTDARRLAQLRVELIRKMSETTPLVDKLTALRAAYEGASDPRPFSVERLQAVQLLALRLNELQGLQERFDRSRDALMAAALLKGGRGSSDPLLLLCNDAKHFADGVRLFREKARVAFVAEDAAWQAAEDGWRVRRRWRRGMGLAALLSLLVLGGVAAQLRAGGRPSSG